MLSPRPSHIQTNRERRSKNRENRIISVGPTPVKVKPQETAVLSTSDNLQNVGLWKYVKNILSMIIIL